MKSEKEIKEKIDLLYIETDKLEEYLMTHIFVDNREESIWSRINEIIIEIKILEWVLDIKPPTLEDIKKGNVNTISFDIK